MSALPVEWVLVVYYGPSAHRATYGRLDGSDTKYTKDYIQLSRRRDFVDELNRLFPNDSSESRAIPLTYMWPLGKTPGQLILESADRPHLAWETKRGAPDPWKMSKTPSENLAETIPGNPSHLDFEAAEEEFNLLGDRGAGQPYLLAIKIRGERRALHLRAYLAHPSENYNWASTEFLPHDILVLVEKTSQTSALAWSTFQSGGVLASEKVSETLLEVLASEDPASVIDALEADVGRELSNYLRTPAHGLFFDPTRNHDAWIIPAPFPDEGLQTIPSLLEMLELHFPIYPWGDAAAEMSETSPDEIEVFQNQIETRNYAVPDARVMAKTRGSAQKVFADAVKKNYGFQCAVTGINTQCFLVAAHIVPWSEDESIRLDPSNGICLSLLVDRAFENGFILIDDRLTIRVNWDKVGDDVVLGSQLKLYDGKTLRVPAQGAPKPEFLS